MNPFCLFAVAASLFLAGCTGLPSGVRAVDDFNVSRYLGTWYEIARLDHRFERDLVGVSATYTLRNDGGINVVNRGYDPKTRRWKEVRGRAYLLEGPSVGRFKVTFFWPFYGAYNIIALDRQGYSYAVVCGPDRSYLWILARERTLPASVLEGLVLEAQRLGFETGGLIFVSQEPADNAYAR